MKHVLKSTFLFAGIVTSAIYFATAWGQESGVVGYWREPEGSVIHVDSCGKDVCGRGPERSPSAAQRRPKA